MPSSPGYKRNYAHEDKIRDEKPGEIKKREARNAARHAALKAGTVRKGDNKEVDHIKPLSKGGSSAPTGKNLRVISAHLNDSYPRGHHGELLHQNKALSK
jgi:5-methylcytosine-specific restriction endonuclease McrA